MYYNDVDHEKIFGRHDPYRGHGVLNDRMRQTKDNAEFLISMNG